MACTTRLRLRPVRECRRTESVVPFRASAMDVPKAPRRGTALWAAASGSEVTPVHPLCVSSPRARMDGRRAEPVPAAVPHDVMRAWVGDRR